jgi:hypothetical protein
LISIYRIQKIKFVEVKSDIFVKEMQQPRYSPAPSALRPPPARMSQPAVANVSNLLFKKI